jgi:hypothetical protein
MTPDAIQSVDPYRRSSIGAAETDRPEFTFDDALDIVNPLQHIPLIGWLYREVTGDTIKTPSAIAGGALYGGPVGFAGAILAAAFESISGESPETAAARLLSPPDRLQGLAAYDRAAGLAKS